MRVTPLSEVPVASGDGTVAQLARFIEERVGRGESFEVEYRVKQPWGSLEEGSFHAAYLGHSRGIIAFYSVENLPMAFVSDMGVPATLGLLGAEATGCSRLYWSDHGAPDSTCLRLAQECGVRLREEGEECMANGFYVRSVGSVRPPSRLDWVLE